MDKMDAMVEIFKALSDKNRLLILEMLSCGELCACEIIKSLNLSQPTVSHHMKILQQMRLVEGRKKGKWMIYSISSDKINEVISYIKYLTTHKENCICNNIESNN